MRIRNRKTFTTGLLPWLMCRLAMFVFGDGEANTPLQLADADLFLLDVCYFVSSAFVFSWVEMNDSV